MFVEKPRYTRQYVLVDPVDCEPPHGLDMNSDRDVNKVMFLVEQFKQSGFDPEQPALVGYPLNGKVQLLTGTHRHEAAKRAGVKLPVKLWLRSDVERTWGTELWPEVIRDIPVKELEWSAVCERIPRVVEFSRVDPTRMYASTEERV